MQPDPAPNPTPYRPENNPGMADHARNRIAHLPDPYAQPPMPSKQELAPIAKPVSPVAVAQPSIQDMPSLSDAALMKRKTPGIKGPLLVGLACFLIPLIIFKLWPIVQSQLAYNKSATKSTAQTTTAADGGGAAVSAEPVLTIPKINVNAPIVFAKDNTEDKIQKDLESGVVHYSGTGEIGHPGNAVIFGHSSNDWWEPGNYKFAFILLDKLVIGDTFSVNYQGKKYIYQVTNVKTVDPSEVGVLAQTSEPTLTLITCTPPGTSWKRLVVTSKLISPAASGSVPSATVVQTPNTLPSNAPTLQTQAQRLWDGIKGLFRRQPGAPVTAS